MVNSWLNPLDSLSDPCTHFEQFRFHREWLQNIKNKLDNSIDTIAERLCPIPSN